MRAGNVMNLGIKELRSLARDPIMMIFIGYAFTVSVYAAATAIPEVLNKTPIAIVDEDQSPLSMQIISAFYPPYFLKPDVISQQEMDRAMDEGAYTFTLNIPPDFERDLLAKRSPSVQLNVDATRMSQAFSGSGYIQMIINDEVNTFLQGHRTQTPPPVDLVLRARFNPELKPSWFGAVMQVMDNVTMLSIILAGAALIREREHGTIEHLLAMPVTPFEIMTAKVWSMGLVVLVATAFSVQIIVRGMLAIPIAGSIPLFLFGSALHLFATTSLGIFLGTVARSMPQFGLLLMLVLLPLQMLSGAMTPYESMPEFIQILMLAAPTTHFVMFTQAILYRGVGLAVVWPQFASLIAIGSIMFGLALARFRKTVGAMV